MCGIVLRNGHGTPTPLRGVPGPVGSKTNNNVINSFYCLGFLYDLFKLDKLVVLWSNRSMFSDKPNTKQESESCAL